MGKKPVSRLESIPMPETIRDIFLKVPEDEDHVSYSGSRESEKNSHTLPEGGHAFYLGKFFAETVGQKVADVLGWKSTREKAYSETFIESSLDYLFRHTKPGDKPVFIICRSFSEIFNGSEDVKGALSTNEEIALIYRIARRKFGRKADQLTVIDVESEPQNESLFKSLRGSIDPETEIADLEKAYGQEAKVELGSNPDALTLAKYLYQAAKQNPKLNHVFRSPIPPGVRKEKSEADLQRMQNYSLTEIAIRLAAILNGRHVHGGITRQGYYDEIIERIVQGKKGSYKNIAELFELLKLFEGKTFETIHLDNEVNPQKLKQKRARAIARLVTYTALAASSIVGAAHYGVQSEKKRQSEQETKEYAMLTEEMKDVDLIFENKFEVNLETKIKVIQSIARSLTGEMIIRYNLPRNIEPEELRYRFINFLINNKSSLHFNISDPFYNAELIDQFVRENRFYFEQKGIKIERPYPQFRPSFDLMKRLFEVSPDYDFKHTCAVNPLAPGFGFKNLGKFTGITRDIPLPSSADFEVCRYADDGQETLLARYSPIHDYDETAYTVQTARKFAIAFARAMLVFDASEFAKYNSSIYLPGIRLHALSGQYYTSEVEMHRIGLEQSSDVKILGTYEDFFGRFKYEMGLFRRYNDEYKTYSESLVAKLPGDTDFTTERALEAARHIDFAQKASDEKVAELFKK